MRINDPSLWPDDLGDLRFQPQSGRAQSDVVVVFEDGATLALLFYRERCDVRPLCGGVDVTTAGWELVLAGDEIEILDRGLLVEPGDESSRTLTDGVIAWAALTILSRRAGRVPGRG